MENVTGFACAQKSNGWTNAIKRCEVNVSKVSKCVRSRNDQHINSAEASENTTILFRPIGSAELPFLPQVKYDE